MTIETQFEPWDMVWAMFDNKPVHCRVEHVSAQVPIVYAKKEDRTQYITYSLAVPQKDRAELRVDFGPAQVFATKKELLASL